MYLPIVIDINDNIYIYIYIHHVESNSGFRTNRIKFKKETKTTNITIDLKTLTVVLLPDTRA